MRKTHRMKFAHAKEKLLSGQKTVTRRTAWYHVRPGDLIIATDETGTNELARLKVVSVQDQRIEDITTVDVFREGFTCTKQEFVKWFCKEFKRKPQEFVNRIEFRKVSYL